MLFSTAARAAAGRAGGDGAGDRGRPLGRRGHPRPAPVPRPADRRRRRLLVVTYRDDEVGPLHPLRLVAGDLATAAAVRRLRLAPLSRQAWPSWPAAHGVDPDALHRPTGGNPFFVTEVLAAGDAACRPPSCDAVLARAARLSPAARQVARRRGGDRRRRSPPGCSPRSPRPRPTHVEECLAAGMLREPRPTASPSATSWPARPSGAALAPARRAALHRRVLAALLGPAGRRRRPGPAGPPRRGGRRRRGRPRARAGGRPPGRRARRPPGGGRPVRPGAALRRRAGAGRAGRAAGAPLLRVLPDRPASRTRSRPASGRSAAGASLGDRRREGDTLRWLSRLAWFAGPPGRGRAGRAGGRRAAGGPRARPGAGHGLQQPGPAGHAGRAHRRGGRLGRPRDRAGRARSARPRSSSTPSTTSAPPR